MTGVTKLALIPLVALWLWALPRDQPNTDVAGALVVTAVDVDAVTADNDRGQSELVESSGATGAGEQRAAPAGAADATSETLSAAVTSRSSSTTSVTETSSVAPSTVAPVESSTPTTSQTTTSQPPPEALANVSISQQALDRMAFDWQRAFPTWTVEFTGAREGLRALTYPHEHRVEVFVRSSDTAETLHRVLAHEIGHVIDVQLNDDADRARWVQQRNLPSSAPWWPNAAAPDFATGAGDFAEAVAVLETGVVSQSSIGGQPTAADLELLRELMRG